MTTTKSQSPKKQSDGPGTKNTPKHKSASTHTSPQENIPKTQTKIITTTSNAKGKPPPTSPSPLSSLTPVPPTKIDDPSKQIKQEKLDKTKTQDDSMSIDSADLYSNEKWEGNQSPKKTPPSTIQKKQNKQNTTKESTKPSKPKTISTSKKQTQMQLTLTSGKHLSKYPPTSVTTVDDPKSQLVPQDTAQQDNDQAVTPQTDPIPLPQPEHEKKLASLAEEPTATDLSEDFASETTKTQQDDPSTTTTPSSTTVKSNLKPSKYKSPKKTQTNISGQTTNVTRFTLSFNVPEDKKGTAGTHEQLVEIYTKMRDFCPTLKIQSWYEDKKLDEIISPHKIPENITTLQKYFPGVRSLDSGGILYSKINLSFPIPFDRDNFEKDIDSWGKSRSVRFYILPVQHANVKTARWLPYLTRFTDVKTVSRMMASSYATTMNENVPIGLF